MTAGPYMGPGSPLSMIAGPYIGAGSPLDAPLDDAPLDDPLLEPLVRPEEPPDEEPPDEDDVGAGSGPPDVHAAMVAAAPKKTIAARDVGRPTSREIAGSTAERESAQNGHSVSSTRTCRAHEGQGRSAICVVYQRYFSPRSQLESGRLIRSLYGFEPRGMT
jgi:hypothetical protein